MNTLFDVEKKTPAPFQKLQPVTQTLRCSGCSATATIQTPARQSTTWPVLVDGWCACGSDAAGNWKLWCFQCQFEGRHERAINAEGEQQP